jgi:hypothetical protein
LTRSLRKICSSGASMPAPSGGAGLEGQDRCAAPCMGFHSCSISSSDRPLVSGT